jgi:hypothetical protein
MADKRTKPEVPESAPEAAAQTTAHAAPHAAPTGAHRKKRAAPTIDLTATEVPQAQPKPAPEPLPDAGQAAPTPPEPPSPGIYTAAIAGGFAGAVIAAAVIAALWSVGVLPAGSNSDEPDTDIVALQKQVQALQNRPAPASVPDSEALEALRQSVRKLEGEMATIAKLPAGEKGVAERLNAADNAMKSLGIALTALNRRTDDVATNTAQARERADAAAKAVADLQASVQDAAKKTAAGISAPELDALQKRIAGLERSAKAARDDIAKASSADRPARLALSAAALRDAVASGAPFAAELAQAKSLGADDKTLAPLAPFAASGVPSAQVLAQELRALLPAMIKISGAQAPQGGFLDRLQANAGKLVRIRPLDAPPGDDASAVLARIEIAAAKADIAAALADLGKLAVATRAPAQAWIEKAKARQAALTAARQYAAATAHALGTKAGAQ